jgi:hypothetical protein
LIEADDEGFAFAPGRGAEVASGAESNGQDVVEGSGLRFEVKDIFPLDDVDLLGRGDEGSGLIAAKGLFLGIFFRQYSYMVVRKKLLRLGAGRSTRAMVVPIHFAHAYRIAEMIGYR